MALVVHPHFHRRRTGITGHVESVVRALAEFAEPRAMGTGLGATIPRISWKELWRRMRREPLIWHAHRNNEMLVGMLLRMLGRQVRIVFTRHASTQPSRYTQWLASRADQFVTLHAQMAQSLSLPSAVVSHGVDLARFQSPVARTEAWQKLALPGRHGVGVVGRVRPAKGQEDFVEAFAPLAQAHPDWTPVFIGRVQPTERSWAQGLAQRLPSLHWVDEQADVRPWFWGLSMVVHPSHSEGYSLVLLEAMAAGCCVVASRLPHVPDVIRHGETGFLYEPGDVAGLRALLNTLLGQPERVREVGALAAKEAQLRFGVGGEAKKLADLYAQLLA